MDGFLLTPGSIPLLAKLLLAVIVTGYVFLYKPKTLSIKWFAGYIAGYTLLDLFAFTGTTFTSHWSTLSLPLQYIASIGFTFCYVQFAYHLHDDSLFKERKNVWRISGIFGFSGLIYLVFKLFSIGFGDYDSIQILVLYPLLMIIWAGVVFLRKHRFEKRNHSDDKYFRGYLVFFWLTIIAIVLSFTPALNALELIHQTTFTLIFFVLNLIIFTILTAAFFQYVAEYSSILIKLVGISLVLFLTLIGIQGYLIIPEDIRLNPDLNTLQVHKSLVPYAWFLIASCTAVLTVFPLFYSRSVLDPLKSIIIGIDKVNEGNLSHKIPVSGSDELGVVGEHLNKMSGNLEKANAELKEYTEGLEQKVQDRTEKLQKQTQELERLQEFRSRLFQDISHELRTPITLISGPLQQVLQNPNLDNKAIDQLQLSLKNSKRLKQLVEQIIDLNRLESDQMVFHGTKTDISGKLNSIVQTYESFIKSKGISIQYDIPSHSIAVLLDEDKFEKIISNLITNAVKFTKSTGTLSVSLKELETTAQIIIHDTGIGISKEKLPHIFDRYQTSAHSEQQYREGLGVGLAITKEYVELHKGKIVVDSKEKIGTQFKIDFPLLLNTEVDTYEFKTVEVRETNTEVLPNEMHQKHSILLVEDNLDMAQYISSVLNTNGFKTDHTEHGKAALEFLKSKTPDLIISDIMMPEMDGMTFLKELRSRKKFTAVPTIFLSARSDVEGKLEGFKLGINDYLVKPFNPEELICRINNLLSFQTARKQIEIQVSEEKNVSVDDELITKLTRLVEERMANTSFNLEDLANEVAMSRSTLYREIKRTTGLSAGGFVKEIRLQKARQRLENQSVKAVNELSYDVGFSTPSYFSKQYKKRFGKKPADYLTN